MNEELEQVKKDYLDKLRKVKLIEAGIDINEVDRYVKYVNVDDEQEIEEQANTIAADANRKPNYINQHVDSRTWKPFN